MPSSSLSNLYVTSQPSGYKQYQDQQSVFATRVSAEKSNMNLKDMMGKLERESN
jgi:hypothetical protein